MNFAQDKGGSSRLTGFGLVVLVHVLIVGALASGLATKIKEAVKGPIDVKVVEEKVKPPPPPEKVVPPPPDIKAPPPPFVPPPEVVVTAPPPPTQTVAVMSRSSDRPLVVTRLSANRACDSTELSSVAIASSAPAALAWPSTVSQMSRASLRVNISAARQLS